MEEDRTPSWQSSRGCALTNLFVFFSFADNYLRFQWFLRTSHSVGVKQSRRVIRGVHPGVDCQQSARHVPTQSRPLQLVVASFYFLHGAIHRVPRQINHEDKPCSIMTTRRRSHYTLFTWWLKCTPHTLHRHTFLIYSSWWKFLLSYHIPSTE